jgi:hypothetical protein
MGRDNTTADPLQGDFASLAPSDSLPIRSSFGS